MRRAKSDSASAVDRTGVASRSRWPSASLPPIETMRCDASEGSRPSCADSPAVVAPSTDRLVARLPAGSSAHLRALLPAGMRATNLSVDGATTAGLSAQLGRLPSDASHLIVSIGGNDALGHRDLLATPVRSTAEALSLFARRIAGFEADYRRAIVPVVTRGLPVT